MAHRSDHGPWLIYGARSYALTIADLIRDTGGEVLGMIEDGTPEDSADVMLCSFEQAQIRFRAKRPPIALGIGYRDLPARWRAWERVRALGWPTPSLIHPEAYVAATAQVQQGAVVMARSIVDRKALIGEGAVLWPGACVNHDSVIGANTFVSPGAIVCGNVRVGAHCFVGAGALLADGSQVPDGTFLKMGTRYSERPLPCPTPEC